MFAVREQRTRRQMMYNFTLVPLPGELLSVIIAVVVVVMLQEADDGPPKDN